MAAERQYRLRVGEVVIALNCPDPQYAASLAEYFAQPCDPAPPVVELDLNIVLHDTEPAVPNSLILTKALTGDGGFDIADGLIRGRFDPATGKGELHVMNALTSGLLTRVFEQILYQAWHSGRRRLGYDACLVHSSGVIRNGRGYLFVGASEAGKTTVANLSQDYTVTNDEMNLVEFHADGARLRSTPFNGHYRDKQAGTAPLAAVLLLEQGPAHRLESVGCGLAAGAVAGQIAPPVGLEEVADTETRLAMLDLGSRLVEWVPVRRLIFLPDRGFWPIIKRTFTAELRG
jgi:hypothetical protein